MKGYRILVLMLGVLLLLGVTAAPALACDDCCSCCDPRTPGYWKNHTAEWAGVSFMIGNVTYTQADILPLLKQESGDKWVTLFRAFAAAKLNLDAGCDAPCWIDETIGDAHDWLETNAGSRPVAASSCAWKSGECLYLDLDWWNNT